MAVPQEKESEELYVMAVIWRGDAAAALEDWLVVFTSGSVSTFSRYLTCCRLGLSRPLSELRSANDRAGKKPLIGS